MNYLSEGEMIIMQSFNEEIIGGRNYIDSYDSELVHLNAQDTHNLMYLCLSQRRLVVINQ